MTLIRIRILGVHMELDYKFLLSGSIRLLD